MSTGYLRGLVNSYKIYIVNSKPGLPPGYSLSDMSNDYAVMINNEVGRVANIIGVSTGWAIAQHFAIDHPDLVRRLIFYPVRETARKISNAKLVLYSNLGHNAMFARSRQFGEEIRAFLLGRQIGRPWYSGGDDTRFVLGLVGMVSLEFH